MVNVVEIKLLAFQTEKLSSKLSQMSWKLSRN